MISTQFSVLAVTVLVTCALAASVTERKKPTDSHHGTQTNSQRKQEETDKQPPKNYGTDDTQLDENVHDAHSVRKVVNTRTAFQKGDKHPTGAVAFSAHLTTDLTAAPEDTLISYDTVHSNYGDGFDGIYFTAPENGVYFFTFTGLGEPLFAYMYHEGVRQAAFSSQDAYSSVSNSVIIYVNQGERVWTELRGGDVLLGNPAYPLSSGFSGFLIYQSI